MTAGKLTIKTAKLGSLVPAPYNTRLHNEANLSATRASLERFGQVEPLVTRELENGTYEVVGGNGRLEAMQSLEWDVAKIVVVELTDPEAKALSIALNRTAELATWDESALFLQITEMIGEGVPSEDLGWSDGDVEALAASVDNPPDTSENVDPDPDTPKAKQGRPINMTVEQRQIFDQAVLKLRQVENEEWTEGKCVEMVCADWLSGH